MVEDLSNKQAAGLCAYVLSRSGPEALSFKNSTDAFTKLGELFHVKANTIKNFRDSFDPFTDSSRAGWHKQDRMRPNYLNDIYDDWHSKSDPEIIDAARRLMSFTWLPNLEEIWSECENALNAEPDLAELIIPQEIANRIAHFLSQKRSYSIDHLAPTAMHITSKDKKQKSIISFAVLSKLKHIIPYLNAISGYKEAADLVLKDLLDCLPSSEQKTEQAVFNSIRSNLYDESRLTAALKHRFGSAATVEQFQRALKDEAWSGIKKSIFRSKKDVLNSVCLNKLNFENVKTGYIENLIEYFIDTGDELPELSGVSSSSTQHRAPINPDLDRNIIFVGAPGTGKSFAAQSYAGKAHIERVVFYKDYQNADFVGYLQPQADPKFGAKYEFETGPFLRALKHAFDSPNEPVVLLIEEINRGDAPAIFGEVFQLLDRDHTGDSEYKVGVASSVMKELSSIPALAAENKIWLPSNLFIVATMNSSDQGVAPLDGAFTRRFGKRYVPINFDAHNSNPDFTDAKINLSFDAVSWSVFASAINEVLLDANFPEDKLLGPFFLSPSELAKPDLDASIVQKVCFYLWEEILRYDDKSLLFDDSVRSFSDLQKKYNLRQMVFSEAVREQIVSQSRTEETDLNEDISSSAD